MTGGSPALSLELFVTDPAASRDFYTRVLGFDMVREEKNGYVQLRYGAANIALNPQTNLPAAADAGAAGGKARQFEISLTVDDVEAACRHVQDAGWPLRAPLKERPWGQTDFRVHDPDGYSIRFTSP